VAQIIPFVPKREVDAFDNVNAFIEMVKNELTVFGADLNWDAVTWNMSDHVRFRSGKPHNLVWRNWDTTRNCKGELIKAPIADFAKAFTRYSEGVKKTKSPHRFINSFRALERVLLEMSLAPCITQVTVDVLNRSQALLSERYICGRAEANYLEKISTFLNEKMMLRCPPFQWKHSISRKQKSNVDFKGDGTDKLPTDSCLYAIADIFHSSSDPINRVAAGVAIILLSNPCRIGEVLTLDKGCLLHDHQGKPGALGLRIFPEKGGDPFVKPILPVWREILQDVVDEILVITNEARKIAKWYENNPTKLYLPPDFEHLRGEEYVDTKTAMKLLDVSKTTFSTGIISKYDIMLEYGGYQKPNLMRFSDLEAFVTTLFPEGFPYRHHSSGLKYSDSLFVFPYHFFRSYNTYSPVMVQKLVYSTLSNLYGSETGYDSGKSIFEKYGHYEPDGSKIYFRCHSARHYQESLLDHSHVSQTFRAFFAGRKDISQNEAYSHASLLDKATKSLDIYDQSQLSPVKVDTSLDVFNRPDALAGLLRTHYEDTVHVTDVGYCVMGSEKICEKFNDHLLCSDHVYIKGDARLYVNLPERVRFYEKLVEDRRRTMLSTGVDVALKHDEQTLYVLKSILAVLSDKTVPDGSFFRLLPGSDYSRMRLAYYKRNKKLLGQTNSANIPLIKVGELCLGI
tara:strand:- start:1130 stop:3172 length:2043 start_codon:yes stop_codon:yes gene_type:complete